MTLIPILVFQLLLQKNPMFSHVGLMFGRFLIAVSLYYVLPLSLNNPVSVCP